MHPRSYLKTKNITKNLNLEKDSQQTINKEVFQDTFLSDDQPNI